jgi:hypothetical protein
VGSSRRSSARSLWRTVTQAHQGRRDVDSLSIVESETPCGEEANDPTRSSYGREYWLRRCEGFLVETPTKRIGRVVGIRYGETTNEPEVLEVRAGLFGRSNLLISVDDITGIDLEQRRLSLADPPELRSE